MIRKFTAFLLFLSAFAATAAHGQHFITNEAYRARVEADFNSRRAEARGRDAQLFSVFDRADLTAEQREALQFLYAYMPLVDLAEYDGEFFLRQVDGAFRARDTFSWGRTVPEGVFRHFVLVHRINNEYLDTSRDVFFEELRDRIKDMSMEQAALEVNHWCHEKVTYRATDPRTSSPTALVRTSWGRCGEESTFTAAAMRAVGIPARQVYTPRWVHTDSNHAWVEVWIDGEWKYLGACEPEPELNVAWFSAPAKRMMMAHTTVMGPYEGNEEVNRKTNLYTIINLLDNYSRSRSADVLVTDEGGAPVEGARVGFKVYNSAEFWTLAVVHTDAAGRASIRTGNGDAMVWAAKDGKFGYGKSEAGKQLATIVLDRVSGIEYSEQYVMNVPVEQPVKALSREAIAQNAVRLAREDSMRAAYMSTFATEQYAKRLASDIGTDAGATWKYLNLAQGNWPEIERFITDNRANPRLFPFLSTLLEKDLRDTPAAFLSDHLNSGQTPGEGVPEDIFVHKVLSPRIHIELIQPWRSFLMPLVAARGLDAPEKIVEYVKGGVASADADNYYACLLTPQGTDELRLADRRSRNVYFVALCRAAGIPAQVETATGRPQYWSGGRWWDAPLGDDMKESNKPKGTLRFLSDEGNIIKPGYGTHYSVAYYRDGDFHTLALKSEPGSDRFPFEVAADEGYYRVMTGSRANDGSVTVSSEYFNLREGETHTSTIKLPEVWGKLFVKGIIDMNSIIYPDAGGKATLKEISAGKGLVICFLDPDKEPSKHILQDLPAQKEELEQWGGGILCMVPDDKRSASFDASRFEGLPGQIVWATDTDRELLAQAFGALQTGESDNFPLVVYLNSNGGILFSNEGYRIGLGEDLLRTVRLEQESMD